MTEVDVGGSTLIPQRCNKHNKLHHDFFISYRVSTDHINSEKLATHLDGKLRHDGNHFATYLDKNCLIQGKDWEIGFTYGIHHSSAILLLISQGLINTMVAKAKRNEVDNVLKEHKMALELRQHGRLIIPVYVASLSTTKSKRDCYIKLNLEAALRQFDGDAEDAAVKMRLQEPRRVLQSIFQIQTSVDIEPDSIAEKVPKILQLWHAEFVKKKELSNQSCWEDLLPRKGAPKQPNILVRAFRYPTQSFRLMFVGGVLGFFGTVFTLSLLLMHSKSKKHTDLKLGVAIGNITAFIVLILVCSIVGVIFYLGSNKVYCSKCEPIVAGRNSSTEAAAYFDKIHNIKSFSANCASACVYAPDDPRYSGCLICICRQVYNNCELRYETSLLMFAVVSLLVVISVGTAVVTNAFTRREAFSASLSQ